VEAARRAALADSFQMMWTIVVDAAQERMNAAKMSVFWLSSRLNSIEGG
jgi:hypothetical protein